MAPRVVRPAERSLKKAAEDKQFDAVLVDDWSRLSRDNQHFNTLVCLFEFRGISLISVSDGLDTREEHAKVAYQFRGIVNELYLTDLKKKTHRGQMGQVRGFSVGSRCWSSRALGRWRYIAKCAPEQICKNLVEQSDARPALRSILLSRRGYPRISPGEGGHGGHILGTLGTSGGEPCSSRVKWNRF